MEKKFLATAAATAAGTTLLAGVALLSIFRKVNAIQRFPPDALRQSGGGEGNPLFRRHPVLAEHLPWRTLGTFPTPIETIRVPHQDAGPGVYVKRDDQASDLYGGNKVRKLEYLLAEAELDDRRTLITLGGIGSNHALAVATHGSRLGFDVDLVLYDQPVTPAVRRNLGGFVAAGARLHYAGSTPRAFARCGRLFVRRQHEGARPYFVMVGGSSRLGCMGYVTAAFELAEQVESGDLPEPDLVFVPLGTCGTAAGLLAGLRLAGLRSRVVAVRVADPFPANAVVLRTMAQDVIDYLTLLDPSLPRHRIQPRDFDVLPNYLGPGYGVPTAEAEAALQAASPSLTLETTYTGKTMAACIDFCRQGASGMHVLFWNTFNSAPIAEVGVPQRLHPFLAAILGSGRHSSGFG